MIRVFCQKLLWCALLAVALGGAQKATAAARLDINGDGVIRIAWLSPPTHSGNIDSTLICADLENMIKAARPGRPVRVAPETFSITRSLMGWFYHPDAQEARHQLLEGDYDLILLAEKDDIVRDYPEFYFEGVRAINEQATARGVRTCLVVMSVPGSSFRDKRLDSTAEIAYRVGDGCGLEIIHAAAAWREALARNRISGDSPIKARACAYLTAATIFNQLTGSRVPKGALEADWTTKRTTEPLARSAREAIALERPVRHYAGPFTGVVRTEPHIVRRLKIYELGASEIDPLRQNLQFILDCAFQDWLWKSPADWYSEGFDRNASAFDLVYGDLQQMSLYEDGQLYSATTTPPTNFPAPCRALYSSHPATATDEAEALRRLETVLFEGYDAARKKGFVFVPYQLAWARARQRDPALTHPGKAGMPNDWLSYMLAHMLYTVVTGRHQPPPEKDKPRFVNESHPHGYHDICARLGYDTIRQLSTLSESCNTVLLRTDTFRIDADQPGFVGIRLLERPTRETRVFCASDTPDVAQLSRSALVFTPDNFDIEQTIRILPATNTPTLFINFMASAQSEDRGIDNAGDQRPFLLNLDENRRETFTFDTLMVAPTNHMQALLRPSAQPCDTLRATIQQHGVNTQEIYFSPDNYSGAPVRLYPSAQNYANGVMPLTISVESVDRRFHGQTLAFTFQLSNGGLEIPRIGITAPENGRVIDGPAFVTAKAETQSTAAIRETAIFLGPKMVGRGTLPSCNAAVEKGAPQSRLSPGTYTLWAAATTAEGVVAAAQPVTFEVRAPLLPANGATRAIPAGADPKAKE